MNLNPLIEALTRALDASANYLNARSNVAQAVVADLAHAAIADLEPVAVAVENAPEEKKRGRKKKEVEVAVETEAEPVETELLPDSEPTDAITVESIRDVMHKLVEKGGYPYARKAVKDLTGYDKITDMKEEEYSEIYLKLKAELDAPVKA